MLFLESHTHSCPLTSNYTPTHSAPMVGLLYSIFLTFIAWLSHSLDRLLRGVQKPAFFFSPSCYLCHYLSSLTSTITLMIKDTMTVNTLPLKGCFSSPALTSLRVNNQLLGCYSVILSKAETSTPMSTEYKFTTGSTCGDISVPFHSI